jgi:hypothetical protein
MCPLKPPVLFARQGASWGAIDGAGGGQGVALLGRVGTSTGGTLVGKCTTSS